MQTGTAPASVASSETAEIALPIVGMTCASCVNRIDRFLRKADGVSEVSVNLATESATIRYLPELTGAADLARVISNAGYEVPAAALDLAGRNNEGEREAAREAMEATRVAAREREKRALLRDGVGATHQLVLDRSNHDRAVRRGLEIPLTRAPRTSTRQPHNGDTRQPRHNLCVGVVGSDHPLP
jgi:copper chaperone CopZ